MSRRNPLRWDVFCRVVDNFGDVGVCWRLAADLAAHGEGVRLWIDDASALAWLAPSGHPGVEVVPWTDPAPALAPGDVVIEAFGCDTPDEFVARMAACAVPPVWLNVEHLSAEDWVERTHGLRSPHRSGLDKWFFFPGFTPRTGGLIREPGLMAERAAFDRDPWLRAQGLRRDVDEQVVVLFCYDDQTALPAMLDTLAGAPTLLLATPGPAARQMRAQPARPGLRVVEMPWLPQPAFDRLLWCADLAFVRGEDSIVRAQWAGVPFVWQIYPQHDGAHGPKLQAFLDAFLANAPAEVGAPLRALWRRWNGLADPAGRAPGPMVLPARPAWAGACVAWRDALLARAPLTAQLIAFVDGKRAGTG